MNDGSECFAQLSNRSQCGSGARWHEDRDQGGGGGGSGGGVTGDPTYFRYLENVGYFS